MYMPSIFGDDLFDSFFDMPAVHRNAPARNDLLKTDVKEKEHTYELSIAMPGVQKENIQAELKDGYLTVKASNKQEKDEKDQKGRYIRRERYYGTASRTFYVGENLKQEDIAAKYENGVLSLEFPKPEERKPEVEEKKYIRIEG